MKKTELETKAVMSAVIRKGSAGLRSMRENAMHAQEINDRLLLKILNDNVNCEYGQKYSFSSINSVEDFKKRVPVIKYSDIEEHVERMYYNNDNNVLTSGRITGYATSSGSIGKPKLIPRTAGEIEVYTRYTVPRFLALIKEKSRRNGTSLETGKGLCMLYQHREKSPFGLVSTNVADIVAKEYYSVYNNVFVLPLGRQFSSDEISINYSNARFGLEEKNCMFMFSVFIKNIAEIIEYIRDNWQILVDDIRSGTMSEDVFIDEDIRKQLAENLRPNPKRADELQREFEKGFDRTIIRRIWPNMQGITAIGGAGAFESFTATVRRYSEGVALDFSSYAASEGLFAVCHTLDKQEMIMLPDSCYYEFIPADSGDGPAYDTLAMSELEPGRDYEIIVTNRSGFYRYRFGDVVHVAGFEGECPLITFSHRKGQLLNINGEKTSLEMMNEVMRRLEGKTGISVRHWAAFVDRGPDQYRYAVLLETGGNCSFREHEEFFEECLRQVNTAYRYYEGFGLIDPPVLLGQRAGTHRAWTDYRKSLGASEEQIKPVYILDTEEKKEFFLADERKIQI